MSATLRTGPASTHAAGTALLLALVALALHARVLAFPALEVSDAALSGATNARQALGAGGLGGLVLHLLGFGESALPARLAALALHASSTALVFRLGLLLGVARAPAVLLALLFAAHPLRVEAVAWASRLGTTLGACAFLLGCVLALGGVRRRAASGALVVALLADPPLLGGVVWLVLVERHVLRRRGAALGLELAPILAVALWWLGDLDAERGVPAGILASIVHLPLALSALAGRWIAPLEPTPYEAHAALGDASPLDLVAGWVVLAGALAVALRPRTRTTLPALGLALFVLAGALHAALPRDAVLGRDSEAYLPALGLELALVALAAPFLARTPRLVLPPLIALVVVLAVLGQQRIEVRRDERTLQEAALAVRPEPDAHVALGRWHVLHGRLGTAQREFERALALDSSHLGAALGLGELALRRGMIPGQEEHLAEAARLFARIPLPAARLGLGEALQRAHRDAEARDVLQEVAAALPYDAVAHVRLGMAALALGDTDAARASFERAVELDPAAPEAWCGLGIAWFQASELDRAAECFERALELEPDHVESNATLGRVSELRGELAEAEALYRRAVGVNPDSIDALFALGVLLQRTGRGDEALRYLERTVELRTSPPHVRASLALAELLVERRDLERARSLVERVLAFNPAQAEARALAARIEAAERR